MALLTPLGLARLFPGSAGNVANSLVDGASLVGDRAAATLLRDASARPDRVADALDAWLLQRLAAVGAPPSIELFQAASVELASASRVAAVAETLGLSRRHLSRVVKEHVGVGPKELLDLHRLTRSLVAVRAGSAGAAGFSDQAHQIREWRRRLRTTPGRYAREGSPLATAFEGAPSMIHYL